MFCHAILCYALLCYLGINFLSFPFLFSFIHSIIDDAKASGGIYMLVGHEVESEWRSGRDLWR